MSMVQRYSATRRPACGNSPQNDAVSVGVCNRQAAGPESLTTWRKRVLLDPVARIGGEEVNRGDYSHCKRKGTD